MRKHINLFSLGSIIIFAFLLIFIGGTILGMDKFYKKADTRQTVAIKKTIQKAAVHCYALEGAYPPDLAYLEKNYGIILNKEKYFYNYEIFASNIAPQVDVLPINRGGR